MPITGDELVEPQMTRDDSSFQKLQLVGALTGAFEAALWLIPTMFVVGLVTGMLVSRFTGTLNTVLSIVAVALLVGFATGIYYRVFTSIIRESKPAPESRGPADLDR